MCNSFPVLCFILLWAQNPNPNAPAVLYPELIVVVAHDLYQKFNKDIWKTIAYIVAFYNGVDIVYREFQNPKIRFNIAAIVVEDEYGVFEYLENAPSNKYKVKANTIYDAAEFWYQQKTQFPLDTYDAVISMTARTFCQGSSPSTEDCSVSIEGLALPSGMCQYSHAYKEITKVATVADFGNFGSIQHAAHELAHLLGAYHDRKLEKSEKVGFVDIQRCNTSFPYNSAYIMYPSDSSSTNGRYWSDCTLDYFQRYLREENHTCLHNVPESGQHPIPRFIPGKIIGSLEDFCRSKGFGKNCARSYASCRRQCCEIDGRCLCFTRTVLDGVFCDDTDSTKFCMVGKCVSPKDFK